MKDIPSILALRTLLRAGVMSRNEEEGGRGTLRMNSFLPCESACLGKSNSSERGHACL